MLLVVFALAACTEPPVDGLPAIMAFTADPGITTRAQSVSLSWSVVRADSVTLMPGQVDVTGLTGIEVAPESTTTFALVAQNAAGTRTRTVEVRVGDAPMVVAFGRAGASRVNPGLAVELTWQVEAAESLLLRGPGLGAGLPVSGQSGYSVAAVEPGATYTLVATNAFAVVEVEAQVGRSVPAMSVLVVGQSNAEGFNINPVAARAFIAAEDGVMMLGNDYAWKSAYEPLDDCTGQVDLVSADPVGGCERFEENVAGVSAGVSLGNGVVAATGGEVFLIPGARGGTEVNKWLPAGDPYLRSTLFGSAAHRGRLAGIEQGAPMGYRSGGVAFGAVYWYQGESDTSSLAETDAFKALTPIVLDAFQDVLDAPIVLAQLARRGAGAVERNLNYQVVREAQRSMETGARAADGDAATGARERTYLVVTHDLPLTDGTHLTAAGQKELGRRISLVIRQHLLGESIDGSGPRLVRVEQASPTVVRVHADRPVTAPVTPGPAAYSGYFAVIAAGDQVALESIDRDPGDPKVVRITLGSAVAGPVEVRYMPPPVTITSVAADVIRSASCTEPTPGTGLCLPLPAFGAAIDGSALSALSTFFDPD